MAANISLKRDYHVGNEIYRCVVDGFTLLPLAHRALGTCMLGYWRACLMALGMPGAGTGSPASGSPMSGSMVPVRLSLDVEPSRLSAERSGTPWQPVSPSPRQS